MTRGRVGAPSIRGWIRESADRVREIVKTEMENAVSYSVKLEADVHDGKNWYMAKG